MLELKTALFHNQILKHIFYFKKKILKHITTISLMFFSSESLFVPHIMFFSSESLFVPHIMFFSWVRPCMFADDIMHYCVFRAYIVMVSP